MYRIRPKFENSFEIEANRSVFVGTAEKWRYHSHYTSRKDAENKCRMLNENYRKIIEQYKQEREFQEANPPYVP